MCHANALQRDDERFRDMFPRIARLPLGSGALSGNPFPIDRHALARELGFTGGVCPNSMDAVMDRDFVMEFIFACSMLGVHLSRFCEDLIVYSSAMFGFVQCSDAYKRDPVSCLRRKIQMDWNLSGMSMERTPFFDGVLFRGKSGRLMGNVMSIMSVIKGLPTTYNKDLQECWEVLFETADTVNDCLEITRGILSTLTTYPEKMMSGAQV